MTHRDRWLATLLLMLAAAGAHAALTLDRSAPIAIEADSATIDEPAGTATYRGRVVLRQGTITLQTAELVLYVKDGKAQKAIATGTPARLKQAATATEEAIEAEARRITFLVAEERMVLENQARLRQGERLFQGATINYETANRRVSASGGERSRVLLVLPPSTAGETAEDAPRGAPATEAPATP